MRWSPAARRGRVAAATASRASAAAERSFVAWNCFLKTSSVYRSSTLGHNEEETEEEGNGDGVLHNGKQQLVEEGGSAGSGGVGSCRNAAAPWKLAMVQEQDTGMESRAGLLMAALQGITTSS